MNPTAQNTNDQTVNTNQTPQNQPNQGQVASSVQPTPVGSVQKESGPAVATDFIKPTEKAPEVPAQLTELGVEATPSQESPKLSLEDKKAGLGLAKESTAVITSPSGMVTLPMSGQQAKQALHRKVSDSMRWLAMLILRQLKKQETKSGKV